MDKNKQEIIMLEAAKYSIRKMERQKREERAEKLLKEAKLRRFVRAMLLNEIKLSTKIPYNSTGINVLQQLLKKIIPVLEDKFKTLTTSKEQRDSFRAHILSALMNTIEPPRSLRDAEKQYLIGFVPKEREAKAQPIPINEEAPIDIDVEDPKKKEEAQPPGFIDVDNDGAPDAKQTFGQELGLEDLDSTGRNLAHDVFRNVGKFTAEDYTLLDNDVDRQLFHNYLLTNVKLYFDRFEEELQTIIDEPSTPEYDSIAAGRAQAAVPPEDAPMSGDGLTGTSEPDPAMEMPAEEPVELEPEVEELE